MRKIMAAAFILGMLACGVPAMAQEGAVAESADAVLARQAEEEKPAQDSAAPPVQQQDESTLARRVELAKKMHEFRSTREQVDSAVRRAALRLPEAEREGFIAAMSSVLNYTAIERISVDAMAETFTVEELEAMVGYYSKPEARSASEKTDMWAAKVQPEIVRMIDKAMMRVRAGAPR